MHQRVSHPAADAATDSVAAAARLPASLRDEKFRRLCPALGQTVAMTFGQAHPLAVVAVVAVRPRQLCWCPSLLGLPLSWACPDRCWSW